MNQAISNVFPKLLEKTQKNPKKSLDLAGPPPPSLENFQTFLGFFFEGFPYNWDEMQPIYVSICLAPI